MIASVAMHKLDEAELRAVLEGCVKVLAEAGADDPAETRTLGEGAPVEQLLFMLNRDHARWSLQKLAAETPGVDG